jgi:hypothetical protein
MQSTLLAAILLHARVPSPSSLFAALSRGAERRLPPRYLFHHRPPPQQAAFAVIFPEAVSDERAAL